MSKGSGAVVKIFLFGVLFVGIFGIMTITYNIINSSNPNVLNNCIEGGLERIHSSGLIISSSESAKNALEPVINETPIFTGNIFETCGVGYTFESGEDKYLVCEDGTISKYVTVCKNNTLVEKGSGYISTLKEGASIDQEK